MKEYKPKKLCLSYIERTGLYIKKLRTGSSYDDESGLMVDNPTLIKILYNTTYNFRTMSSYSVMLVLRRYFLGFEHLSPEWADIDAIKYAVMELCD